MIGATTNLTTHPDRIIRAANRAHFRNLGHAAASIRKDAAATIHRRRGPSEPGEPPHTHRGAFYRKAIRFFVDKVRQEAIVGFRHSVVGEVGALHEFGGTRDERRQSVVIYRAQFEERPTIGPALERGAARLGNTWRGTIGI